MDICTSVLVLVGYAFTINPFQHKDVTNMDSPIAQIMSCDRGFGIEAKISSKLVGGGFQYAFKKEIGDFSVSLIPKAGFTGALEDVKELPMEIQFGIGAQLLVGYKDFRLGIEEWHASNARLHHTKSSPNLGTDLVLVTGGWAF